MATDGDTAHWAHYPYRSLLYRTIRSPFARHVGINCRAVEARWRRCWNTVIGVAISAEGGNLFGPDVARIAKLGG